MAKVIHCPICHRPVSMDDPNMPFCSDRCRLIDLGNWASEKYVIPGREKTGELDEWEETDAPKG
jgi:endogenous inhibitor of DNA gyrase (YacG/DUF329 family)